jgi:hypothetical protein
MIVNWPSCACGGSSFGGRNDSSPWKRSGSAKLPPGRSLVPAVAAWRGDTGGMWALVRWHRFSHSRPHVRCDPRDMLRWIGYPGVPYCCHWTCRQKPPKPASLAIPLTQPYAPRPACMLISHQTDLEQASDGCSLRNYYMSLWDAVRPLCRTEPATIWNWTTAEIVQVREAWLCPVTRGCCRHVSWITPYLPEATR